MSPPGRLQDKIAIVTGASSGIGRAIALRYYREGAHVVCADLEPIARLEAEQDVATHELITQQGGQAIFVKCDVSEEEQVQNLVKTAVERFGRIDIMVNNAGILIEQAEPQPIYSMPLSFLDRTHSVNVRGVFLGLKHASAQMITQKPNAAGSRGWIVNTASVFGLVGVRNSAAYVASKHAVMGLTRSAALDCAEYGVHVNAICPGFTRSALIKDLVTDEETVKRFGALHPLGGGRFGEPRDVTGAAVFLASEDAAWVSGSGLTVDGGYTAQ